MNAGEGTKKGANKKYRIGEAVSCRARRIVQRSIKEEQTAAPLPDLTRLEEKRRRGKRRKSKTNNKEDK